MGYEKEGNFASIVSTVGAFGNPYVKKEKEDIARHVPRFNLTGDNQADAKQIDKLVYLDRTHHVLIKIAQKAVQVEVSGINEAAKTPNERWVLEDIYQTPIL